MYAVVETKDNRATGVSLRKTKPAAIELAVALADENGLETSDVREALDRDGCHEDGEYCLSIVYAVLTDD
jgi:hypothetical protein